MKLTAVCKWSDLPKEIWLDILQYMTLVDLFRGVRLVCRRWNNLALCSFEDSKNKWLNLSCSDVLGGRLLSDESLFNLQFNFDLSNFEAITLRNQVSITDNGFRCTIAMSPYLAQLSLANCVAISDMALLTIGRLRCLTSLDISGCRNISNRGIKYMCLGKSPPLRNLDISGCVNITDIGLESISYKFGATLVKLLASQLSEVTDYGVDQLTRKTVLLQYLDISFCPKITDTSSIFLASSGITTLRLEGCQMSSNARKMIARHNSNSSSNSHHSDQLT
ncbi:uncharacterized protein LOC142347394 isoform X2 [Convolutriloba macropyga]|uniref:uncharacterized protein LOC142347394 isoform X2 n=1 Tax=Convolutriloba macropyga TaxID=536237 RepID=UPI003F51D472